MKNHLILLFCLLSIAVITQQQNGFLDKQSQDVFQQNQLNSEEFVVIDEQNDDMDSFFIQQSQDNVQQQQQQQQIPQTSFIEQNQQNYNNEILERLKQAQNVKLGFSQLQQSSNPEQTVPQEQQQQQQYIQQEPVLLQVQQKQKVKVQQPEQQELVQKKVPLVFPDQDGFIEQQGSWEIVQENQNQEQQPQQAKQSAAGGASFGVIEPEEQADINTHVNLKVQAEGDTQQQEQDTQEPEQEEPEQQEQQEPEPQQQEEQEQEQQEEVEPEQEQEQDPEPEQQQEEEEEEQQQESEQQAEDSDDDDEEGLQDVVDENIEQLAQDLKEERKHKKELERIQRPIKENIKDLCQSNDSFLLNDQNWYQIGLEHNHKQEFSQLLQEIKVLFGDQVKIHVAFSQDGDICFGSDTIIPLQQGQEQPPRSQIDVNQVLYYFTYQTIDNFQKSQNPIIDFNAQQNQYLNVVRFQAKVSYSQQQYSDIVDTTFSNFRLVVDQDFEISQNFGKINVDRIVFLQEDLSTVYKGQLQINQLVENFQLTTTEFDRDNQVYDIFIQIDEENSFSLATLVFRVFGQEKGFSIVSSMDFSQGIQDAYNIHAQKIILQFDRSKDNLKLLARNRNIIDFAITPQIKLHRCRSWLVAEQRQQQEGEGVRVRFKGFNLNCRIHNFPQHVYLHMFKSPTQEAFMVKSEHQEIQLSDFKNDIVTPIIGGDEQFEFSRQIEKIFKDDKTFIHNLNIDIQFQPKLIYHLDSQIGVKNWEEHGELEILFVNINEKIRHFVQLHFGPQPVKDFLTPLSRLNTQQQQPQDEHSHDFPAMKTKSSYLFSSSYQIDLEQYQYLKNNVTSEFGPPNANFWEKGVYFQTIFDIQQEDCGTNNKICQFLQKHNITTQNLYLKGQLDNYEEKDLVISGDLSDLTLAENIKFRDTKLNLKLIKHQNNDQFQADIYKINLDDFYITGVIELPISAVNFLESQAQLHFSKDGQGILITTEKLAWPQAFEIDNLNFNQLVVKGYFDDVSLKFFKMTALAVFGHNCFVEHSNQQVQFQSDTCFFGNVHVKLDFIDSTNNFFEGYFQDVTILHILTTVMQYDPVNIYTQINQSILDIKFVKGASITYAYKNIVDVNTEQVIVPEGISISGESNYLGIDGSLLMNIDIQEKNLLGMFHFSTLGLAAGNVVLFEENIHDSNNILIEIFNEADNQVQSQIKFDTQGSLLGVQKEFEIEVDEQHGYDINFQQKVFDSPTKLNLNLHAPYQNSIVESPFTLSCQFSDNHIGKIEDYLKTLTIGWMERVQGQLVELHGHLDNLEKIVEDRRDRLCDVDVCARELECVSQPEKRCASYKQKQVCLEEEEYCTNVQDQCVVQEDVCLTTEEVCVQWDQNVQNGEEFQCIRYQESCTSMVKVCQKWESQCVGQKIQTCSNYIYVDDEEQCLEYIYGCNLELVKDKTCEAECDRRQESYQYYTAMYNGLQNSLSSFEQKIEKFQTMANQVQQNSNFLKVLNIGFRTNLENPLKRSDIEVEFKIQSFGEIGIEGNENINTFIITEYQFDQEQEMISSLFRQIQEKWSEVHEFSPIIVYKDKSQIVQEIFKFTPHRDDQQLQDSENIVQFLSIQEMQKGL